jgi:hypothetical protein
MENINITSTSELNQHLEALVARLDSQDEVNQEYLLLQKEVSGALREMNAAMKAQGLLIDRLVDRLND